MPITPDDDLIPDDELEETPPPPPPPPADFRGMVRENPVGAVIAAFVMGMVVSRLL